MAASRRVIIKSADMEEAMINAAVQCASQALDKFSVEKDMATYIKKEFDQNYGATWHCVIGRSFGSYVTHEAKHFAYFYIDSHAVLLFKSGY